MFTTEAQTLQLNQCYLEVHGIKYAPEVCNELMQLHRRGNFVNKTSVYQHQIYNIEVEAQVLMVLIVWQCLLKQLHSLQKILQEMLVFPISNILMFKL